MPRWAVAVLTLRALSIATVVGFFQMGMVVVPAG
jgi:hypothetical protein